MVSYIKLPWFFYFILIIIVIVVFLTGFATIRLLFQILDLRNNLYGLHKKIDAIKIDTKSINTKVGIVLSECYSRVINRARYKEYDEALYNLETQQSIAKILEFPLEILKSNSSLPTRTFNYLMFFEEDGIKTVADLIYFGRKRLFKLMNCTKYHMKNIESMLESVGLSFDIDPSKYDVEPTALFKQKYPEIYIQEIRKQKQESNEK